MILEDILIWIRDKWQGQPCGERGLRSSRWPLVRKKHIEEECKCQWCGRKKSLEVHHIQPFHLKPELELDDTNLITLCNSLFGNCHFIHGHFRKWTGFNAAIREECQSRKKRG